MRGGLKLTIVSDFIDNKIVKLVSRLEKIKKQGTFLGTSYDLGTAVAMSENENIANIKIEEEEIMNCRIPQIPQVSANTQKDVKPVIVGSPVLPYNTETVSNIEQPLPNTSVMLQAEVSEPTTHSVPTKVLCANNSIEGVISNLCIAQEKGRLVMPDADIPIIPLNVAQAKDSSAVYNKINEVGMLTAVTKLITSNITQADVEKITTEIHMLVDKLSYEQALVVTKFETKGINILEFVTSDYNAVQMYCIGYELENGNDIGYILNAAFSVTQMCEIQRAVKIGVDVTSYAKPDISVSCMQELCTAVQLGIDISDIVQYAYKLDWLQIKFLITLRQMGIDITNMLENSEEYDAETLLNQLSKIKERKDNAEFVLAPENNAIIEK